MIIKTKRFILRPYRKGDEKSLQQNINDRYIYRYTCRIPYPFGMKDAKKWVEYCINELKKKTPKEIVFAIEVDGKTVGNTGFQNIEKKAQSRNWVLAWEKILE